MAKNVHFLGTSFVVARRDEILSAIETATVEHPVHIATVNPEFMLEARRNVDFGSALEKMTVCTVDGSGLYFMLTFLGISPDIELYHGADLVYDLFARYQDGSKSFFFLGGPPGLAVTAQKEVTKRFPTIRIVGATDGGIIDPDHVEVASDLANQIRSSKADIVLVGFGAPKQELWIQKASGLAPVMIGVGGTLGFYTTKRRAPRWLRVLHLEWLSRMLRERGHWKRVWNAVVVFSFASVFWKLSGKRRQ